MKKIVFVFVAASLMIACNKKEAVTTDNVENTAENAVSYQVYGDSITKDNAITKEEMLAKYESMKPTDTLDVKFVSQIKATCKKKGCWMTLALVKDQEAFIKFKDYAFFVPKEGAENHTAIVSGKAFIEETSVDQLKHEAKDAGKTQAEIDQITQPSKNYRFMANGVLIATK